MRTSRRALRCLVLALSLPTACGGQGKEQQPGLPSDGLDVGTIEATASMASRRAGHSATTLPDGRVLVVGGMTGGDGIASISELFDPATATFSPIGSLEAPRHSHTATLLADGRVLVAGGYGPGGEYLSDAEVFDPATGAAVPAARMTMARAGHAAVLLEDGRVLIVGGVGIGWTFLGTAELYDPVTDAFVPTGPMAVPRESHVALRLRDGRVLVVGGHRGRQADIQLHASIEVFDPASRRFSAAGAMLVARHKHDVLLLTDGRVLITGGADERDSDGIFSSVERYEPDSHESMTMPSLLLPRYKHAGSSMVLADGRVLLAGGASRAEVYDPSGRRSGVVAGTARLSGQFSALAALPDGGALITGGYGPGSQPRAETWLYRP